MGLEPRTEPEEKVESEGRADQKGSEESNEHWAHAHEIFRPAHRQGGGADELFKREMYMKRSDRPTRGRSARGDRKQTSE
jgi:hypothetical protein